MDNVFIIDLILLALVVGVGIATVRSRSLLSSTMLLGIYSLLMALVWVNMFAMDVAFTEAAVGAGISTVLLLGTMVVVGREEKPSRGPHGAALLVTCAVGGALIYGTTDMPAFGDPNSPIHTDRVGRTYISQDVGHVHAIHAEHDVHEGREQSANPQHQRAAASSMTVTNSHGETHSVDEAHGNDHGAHAESHEAHGDHDAHHGDYGTHVPNLVTAVLAGYRSYDTMFETAVIFTAGVCLIVLLRDRKRPQVEEGTAA